jgi:hypothetical protein
MTTANLDDSEAIIIIVGGTRTFGDYEFLKRKMDRLTRTFTRKIVVASGTAAGADTLGERWFWSLPPERRLLLKRFHPDWDKHGKAAGPRRNQEMVDYADRAVFFWDGESPGTRDCIERAKKGGLKVKVYIRRCGDETKRPGAGKNSKDRNGTRRRPPVRKHSKHHHD